MASVGDGLSAIDRCLVQATIGALEDDIAWRRVRSDLLATAVVAPRDEISAGEEPWPAKYDRLAAELAALHRLIDAQAPRDRSPVEPAARPCGAPGRTMLARAGKLGETLSSARQSIEADRIATTAWKAPYLAQLRSTH